MTEDRFEEFLRDAARAHHAPPETPREELWQAIRAARVASVRPARRVSWIYLGVGVAAALAIGIGIGRISMTPSEGGPGVSESVERLRGIPAAYRMTTLEHLARVEIFLTGFQTDPRAGRRLAVLSPQARNLVATTRLLLDSPASEDVALQGLLEDIELVLTQIASYTDRSDASEFQLIDRSIDQRSVLFRLRSATDAAPAGTPWQGAL